MSTTGDKIKRQGWRQGSVVRADDLRTLLPEAVGPAASRSPVGIVVSHSCDLGHADESAEPYAENILGDPLDESLSPSAIGSSSHGKNPRRLCLEVQFHPAGNEWFELKPFDVHRIARESLTELEPDDERFLLERGVRILTTWLAERYRRTALPDDFNELLKSYEKKLKRVYKSLSPAVSAIYIRLHPDGELETDQDYAVDLVLSVPESQAPELPAARRGAERLAELFREAGMDARAVAKEESELSLATVRSMVKLPLDAVSLRGEGHPFDAET